MFGNAMEKLFGPRQVTEAAPQNSQVEQGGDPNAQKTPANNNAPKGESAQLENGNPQKQSSPLDGYADLWKNEPAKEAPQNQPAQNPNPNPQPQEPAFVRAAKGLNFSKNIPAALKQKALAGDHEAFDQILDHLGRQSFAAASHYSEKSFSSSSQKMKDEITGSLPDQFRQFSLANSPIKNPILSKPGVKPVVEGIRLQLASKFPDAPTEELQAKAEKYFLDMASELTGHQALQNTEQTAETDSNKIRQQQQSKGEFDWDKEYGLT